MKKLNDKKIRWIIREKKKGELTTKQIATSQKISLSRVKQLWREYNHTKEIPVLKEAGRKKMIISEEEINQILQVHQEYKSGAVVLEHIS